MATREVFKKKNKADSDRMVFLGVYEIVAVSVLLQCYVDAL